MFPKIILTPFILFLLLLIVLLISIIYGSNKSIMFTEGLSDFTSDILSLGIINIPSYTNPLSKLYGLNYFDPLNGNLIRFVQKTQDTSASTSNKPYTDRPVSITILNRNSSIQPITSFLDE